MLHVPGTFYLGIYIYFDVLQEDMKDKKIFAETFKVIAI